MRFGLYQKVEPVETTPSRVVPEHIERPDYILPNPILAIPQHPEIKDSNQLSGMRRSCKLASNILTNVGTFIKVGNNFQNPSIGT